VPPGGTPLEDNIPVQMGYPMRFYPVVPITDTSYTKAASMMPTDAMFGAGLNSAWTQ